MLHSIGHGARKLPVFLDLLQRYGIRTVADVRSKPGSRFHPQYNRNALAAALDEAGIGYVFLGESLGGRPDDPALRDAAGKPDYDRMRRQPLFRAGLEAVLQLDAAHGPAAMLCSERDPRVCHRSLLVGAALLERGIDTIHIDADGTAMTQAGLEQKKPPQLF